MQPVQKTIPGHIMYNIGCHSNCHIHYIHVKMSAMASQISGLSSVYSTVYSGVDQRKRRSSASLAFVRGIHRWLVNSPHKGSVTGKMFLFHDVIMFSRICFCIINDENGHITTSLSKVKYWIYLQPTHLAFVCRNYSIDWVGHTWIGIQNHQ